MPEKLGQYHEFVYQGFKAMDASSSPLSLSPDTLAQSMGYRIRDGKLYAQFKTIAGPGALPDNNPVFGINSFIDSNRVQHTVALSNAGNIYQLLLGWTGQGTTHDWSSSLVPVSIPNWYYDKPAFYTFKNVLYMSSGNYLLSWDGLAASTTFSVASSVAGSVYLKTITNRLIMGFTNEGVVGTPAGYPTRIRWSATNQPTVWDPDVNIDAGFIDLDDIGDGISGLICIGTTLLILSPTCIKVMTPTGNGALPFSFDNFWLAPYGVGCTMPQTADSFGATGFFVGQDNIYAVTLNGIQAIGTPIADYFFSTLANLTQNGSSLSAPNVFVYGRVVPVNINGIVDVFYNLYLSAQYSNGNGISYVFSYDLNRNLWDVSLLSSCFSCPPDQVVLA